jgi:hypothetical protein
MQTEVRIRLYSLCVNPLSIEINSKISNSLPGSPKTPVSQPTHTSPPQPNLAPTSRNTSAGPATSSTHKGPESPPTPPSPKACPAKQPKTPSTPPEPTAPTSTHSSAANSSYQHPSSSRTTSSTIKSDSVPLVESGRWPNVIRADNTPSRRFLRASTRVFM